jgi:hypothetical protein
MNTIYDILKEKQDGLNNLKLGEEVQVKAAGTMLLANVTGLTSTHVDAQLMPAIPIRSVYAQSIIDYFPKVQCDSHALVIVNQESDDQDAGFASVAEGAAKEQVDFDLRATPKAFTKYAAYVKISDEMLSDISYMESVVRTTLARRIKDKISTDFLAAVIAATPGTLDTDLTAGQLVTKTRHILPAIYNGVLSRKGYALNLWLLNAPDYGKLFNDVDASVDTAWLDMYKPIILPSTAVTTAKVLAVDTEMFPIYVYKDIDITIGYETADFINNLVTIKAETRVAWNIAGECLNALFFDTIADVITVA